MLFIRCAFCHQLVFRPFYASHKAKHTERLADGQMTDHITVHPSGRYQGSLEKFPQVYYHVKCGGGTGMPEEIIRSYLVNPFLYGGGSFCCGCNDYVSYDELFWVETNESLDDYFRGLKRDYIRRYGAPPPKKEI